MEKESLAILIIDPDPSDHRSIRDSLSRSQVPAVLQFVTTTEEGLQKLEKGAFDLILTDHALPAANAFQLLHELQQRSLTFPVILLTRHGETTMAREAFLRGVDDFILKEELEAIAFFDIIGNVIERHRKKEEKKAQENLLRERAERDGLTGLLNHRTFVDALEKEFARAKRYHRNLSLMMIDVDGFKAINDTCGHLEGDQLLRQITRLLLQSVRFVDVVARYGGDEFVVLLPETDLEQAMPIAGRVLEEVRKSPYLHGKKIFPLSVSIGVACLHRHQDSAGTLLREADQALYEAKRTGRNRVVAASLFLETPASRPTATR